MKLIPKTIVGRHHPPTLMYTKKYEKSLPSVHIFEIDF